MGLMGLVGVSGMLMSIGNSGKNSLLETDKLKKSILMMNGKITKFTDGYTELITAEATDIQRIVDEMNIDVQIITQLSKQMESEKNDHALIYRNIQMAGIIIITTIAFIFILKLFNFYDIIEKVLEYPFKNLFSKK
jgi:hypothetical protein